jgi:hypothetical protein
LCCGELLLRQRSRYRPDQDAKGEVSLERKGQSMPARVGMRLETADVLRQAPMARSESRWRTTRCFRPGPNSILSLDRFDYDPTTNQGRFDTQLQKGTLSVISGRMAKQSPDAMTVRTPSAILGVRGTEFVLSAND